MKKIIHKTFQKLLFATGILLITIHSSLAYAKSYSNTEFDNYVKTIEMNQVLYQYKPSRRSSNHFYEDSIVCNGQTVIAAKVIRENLSCAENVSFISR